MFAMIIYLVSVRFGFHLCYNSKIFVFLIFIRFKIYLFIYVNTTKEKKQKQYETRRMEQQE